MPLARIRTQFPEEVGELTEALLQAGYVVETVRPHEFRIAPADLELSVDKLPAIDAWRHLPEAETIYVAPGTPESRDVRTAFGAAISHEPLLARWLVNAGEFYVESAHWAADHLRELRARFNDLRQRWTPPREYHAPVHLPPTAPSDLADAREPHANQAIKEALLNMESLRQREEEGRRALAEQARRAEESRRRAREAAEAKALLEEQQKIEAMVRATEAMRNRVLHMEKPAKREEKRRRPRRLLRTQRERAFARAGIGAFALALALSVFASEALHPRPASSAIPVSSTVADAPAVPFAKPAATAAVIDAQPAEVKPPSAIPSFVAAESTPVAQSTATLASLKPAAGKTGAQSDDDFGDEVIVHKHLIKRGPVARPKSAVAHYSDLD